MTYLAALSEYYNWLLWLSGFLAGCAFTLPLTRIIEKRRQRPVPPPSAVYGNRGWR